MCSLIAGTHQRWGSFLSVQVSSGEDLRSTKKITALILYLIWQVFPLAQILGKKGWLVARLSPLARSEIDWGQRQASQYCTGPQWCGITCGLSCVIKSSVRKAGLWLDFPRLSPLARSEIDWGHRQASRYCSSPQWCGITCGLS